MHCISVFEYFLAVGDFSAEKANVHKTMNLELACSFPNVRSASCAFKSAFESAFDEGVCFQNRNCICILTFHLLDCLVAEIKAMWNNA